MENVATTPPSEGTKVYIWSDEDMGTGYTKVAVELTAELIRAARDDRLVALVCTHNDAPGEKSTVLCISTTIADTGRHQFVPMAQLFDTHWAPWPTMVPPACSVAEKTPDGDS